MRLEVFCEDRLGLTRELLDILASRNIDLRGIEIDISGIIYLNCPDIDFDTFSELMAEIRRISGVKDVRKIQFMPMERHNTAHRVVSTTCRCRCKNVATILCRSVSSNTKPEDVITFNSF